MFLGGASDVVQKAVKMLWFDALTIGTWFIDFIDGMHDARPPDGFGAETWA